MNGLDRATEVPMLYDCFNQYGAFEPLRSLVGYVASSDDIGVVLENTSGLELAVDARDGVQSVADLIGDDTAPLSGGLSIYSELYVSRSIEAVLMLLHAGAGALLSCEEDVDSTYCSLPRLSHRILDSNMPSRVEAVANALDEVQSEEDARAGLEDTIRLLERTSRAESSRNLLVDVGLLLFEGEDGTSTVELVQPWVEVILADDEDGDAIPDFVEVMVPYVSETWLRGDFGRLADQLLEVNTHDVDGVYVGFEGVGMVEQLMFDIERLSIESDPTQLFQVIDAIGLTPLEMGLNIFGTVYDDYFYSGVVNRDVVRNRINLEVEGVVEDVCDGVGRQSEFCQNLRVVEFDLRAIVNTELPVSLLPVIYGLTQAVDEDDLVYRVHGKHLDELTAEELEAVSSWGLEITEGIEELSQITLEERSLDSTLALLPAFIDPDESELTRAGEHAAVLARWAVTPWTDDGGPEVVPLLVPRQVLVSMLSDEAFADALDFMMGDLAPRLLNPESALHLDKIEAMQASFDAHLPETELDPIAEARDVLANEPLWMAGLRLGADAELIELLRPQEGTGATWYFYDLIDRGVVDRMLGFVAGVLDTLIEDDATE